MIALPVSTIRPTSIRLPARQTPEFRELLRDPMTQKFCRFVRNRDLRIKAIRKLDRKIKEPAIVLQWRHE